MEKNYIELRKKAEVLLKEKGIENPGQYYTDIESLMEELSIHQIELEMQNQELDLVRQRTEVSEQKYKDLYYNAPIAYFTLNQTGNIIQLNHSAAKLIGLAPHETRHISIFPFIDDISKTDFRQFFKNISVSYQQELGEILMRDSQGNSIYCNVQAISYIEDETGQTLYRFTMMDINRQKKIQQDLQKSEELFRNIYEQSAVGLIMVAGNGQISHANTKVTDILGYTTVELINMNLSDISYRDDFEIEKEYIRNVIYGYTDSYNMEKRYVHKNGNLIWTYLHSNVVRDHNGKVEYAIGAISDINDRKAIEVNLMKSFTETQKKQSEITELLNATHSILKSSDFKSTAMDIFQACKRSIGAKAGYVALLSNDGTENDLLFLDDGGLPCSVDPCLPMPVRGLRAEAYKSGKVIFDNDFMQSEWVKLMPEGHVALPNILFAPLKIGGIAVGVLGLSNKDTDFTEEDATLAGAFAEYASIALVNSRALENLELRAKELQELNLSKDRLFSIMGHDLKNPIQSIIGFTDLLNKNYTKYDEEKIRKFIQIVHNSSISVYQLLDNLLTWSKTQRQKAMVNPEIIILHSAVQICMELLDSMAADKKIIIQNKLEKDLLAFADSMMINTAIRNLLSNAIKFTQKGGCVTVSARSENADIILEITDTGVGISTEKIAELFAFNETQSGIGTEGEKGTGLGLIICKEFIELNHGKIWVESKVGEGSTFFLRIPCSQ